MPAQSKRRHRLTVKISGVIAGTGLIAGVPTTPLPPAQVQPNIALVSAEDAFAAAVNTPFNPDTPVPGVQNSLDTSLRFILDNMLGIGQQHLDELLGGNGQTMGDLLSGANMNTSLGISQLLDALGMNNLTLGQLLGDFGLYNATTPVTVDGVMDKWGLGDWTLDHLLLSTVGLSHTSTLGDVVTDLSVANDTLDELIKNAGFVNGGAETLGQALIQLNANSNALNLALPLLGWSSSTTLDQVLTSLGQCGGNVVAGCGPTSTPVITSNSTLEQALQAWHVPNTNASFNFSNESLWDYTLGQALGFNQSTTVTQFLDALMVNPPGGNGTALVPLGDMNTGTLLQWIGLGGPNTTLGDLIGNFEVRDQPLGSYTLGDALDGLITNHTLLPSGVTDTTPVATFLDATGWGTMTLDQFLGLGS